MAEYIERTEEIALAMSAGARAIENTKRYHGAIYSIDVSSRRERGIPYLRAAEVLRTASMSSAADVAAVVHGEWESYSNSQWLGYHEDGNAKYRDDVLYYCSNCRRRSIIKTKFCPNCGAKMDGGGANA